MHLLAGLFLLQAVDLGLEGAVECCCGTRYLDLAYLYTNVDVYLLEEVLLSPLASSKLCDSKEGLETAELCMHSQGVVHL